MNKLNTDIIRLEAEDLDQIRASVDWQALFAGLGLRKSEQKSKPNDWWAFSPFHGEKTSSFHMAPGGVWYDFSIGEGGGPIELVQRLHGGNCFEAGRYICERGWAQLDTIQPSAPMHRQTLVKQGVAETVAAIDRQNDPIRQDLIKMCAYHPWLEHRGISEAVCDLLGIGYLPQGRSPLKGRLVFQIADARFDEDKQAFKRVIISHIGRAIDDDTDPKYLFYKGFHKSSELYGQELIWLDHDVAAQARTTGHLILTEGPMDVAKAFEAGIRNVVGSLGANLSETQCQKLRAMADHLGIHRVLVLFDRDKAGQSGAGKAADALKKAGLDPVLFDWSRPIAKQNNQTIQIPPEVQDLGDFSKKQLIWLRARSLI